jgi:hypothetical protein
MKLVVVQYTVTSDQLDTNAALVRAVYAELAERRPEGFHYVTLRSDRSFLHLAAVDDGAENPLPSVAAFREFTSGVRERCEVPPVSRDADIVGGYRLLVD